MRLLHHLRILPIVILVPLSRLSGQIAPDVGLPSPLPVPDLAAFLEAHPTVSGAIICQFPNVTLNYRDWTPAEKDYLRTAFAKAWRYEPSGLPDPLPNAFPLKDDERVRQGLSEQDALQYYFTSIAWSLSFELQRKVSWTITDYSPEELAVLFDSRQMFQLVPPVKGAKGPAIYQINFTVSGNGLPAAPEVGVAFLRKHSMFGTNALGTVSRLLTWCEGLSHFTGNDQTANMRAQWHYDGFPPESRIISGTIYDDGKAKPSPVLSHFTAGCHGTTAFLRSLLRSVNIPVENVHAAGHSLPYFPTINLCMTHGDDPYNMLFRTSQPPLVANQLLLTPDRFDQLFGPKVAAKDVKTHVGIRTRELALDHLPLALLNYYLEDQKQGKSHAEGSVAGEFKNDETPDQLEARKLWTRMDARIAELGGADKVRQLAKQLRETTTNHAAD